MPTIDANEQQQARYWTERVWSWCELHYRRVEVEQTEEPTDVTFYAIAAGSLVEIAYRLGRKGYNSLARACADIESRLPHLRTYRNAMLHYERDETLPRNALTMTTFGHIAVLLLPGGEIDPVITPGTDHVELQKLHDLLLKVLAAPSQ